MAEFTSYSFVMTIFFLLLGPVKIIPPFAKLTREAAPEYKRGSAIWATFFAAVICGLVVMMTGNLVGKYRLSVPALQITGGLILLISALHSIFPRHENHAEPGPRPNASRLALSPLASPIIVTPAGIAALMVLVLFTVEDGSGLRNIATALVVVMLLDLLVMLFADWILKIPGLMTVLQLMGSVLTVVQLAIAVQAFLWAFKRLGWIAAY